MIISLTVLHYGASYLRWALKSVIDYVDFAYVLYSPHGSHGHMADIPCPETRERLFAEAILGAGRKLRWYDGDWKREHEHRGAIHQVCPEADQIIVLDADEIWPEGLIHHMAGGVWQKELRISLVHFWRSFHRAVIDDGAAPIRVICPKEEPAGSMPIAPIECGRIAHMGYAQPEDITAYKILTHGHFSEWRPDWYESRFLANAQHDCHPTNVDYWNPVEVDPMDYLPEWMSEHPFYDRKVIRSTTP